MREDEQKRRTLSLAQSGRFVRSTKSAPRAVTISVPDQAIKARSLRFFVKRVGPLGLIFLTPGARAAPLTKDAPRSSHTVTQPQGEKILVVGVRQPRRLDEMGTSGSFVSATQLRQAQVRDTNDLGRVLPGLQISNSGNFLYPSITVRGITSAQDFYHPATTFYVDDVPVLPINAMQALMDVESVNFLRGPQVALYGQSAEGGVIDIATRQPGPRTKAAFDDGAESRYGYHVNANASGAIVQHWLYGAMFLTSQDYPGNITNPNTGSTHLGGYETRGGRAVLRLAPDDQPWEIGFSVDGSCSYGSQDVYIDFDHIASRRVTSTAPGTPDPRLKRCGHDESLRGIYHLPGWKISAITSLQDRSFSRVFPYGRYTSLQPEQWAANTQELRLGTEGQHKRYDLVTGFFHQTTYQHRQTTTLSSTNAYPFKRSSNRAETVALYGNIYWHLLEKLSLGLGGRLSRDMSDIAFSSTSRGVTQFSRQNHKNQNMSLGNVSLDYEALPGWHLHGRVSQGYKPAGFNYAPHTLQDAMPYNPERELSYEMGTLYHKQGFLARVGYFYNRLQDAQIYVGPIGSQIISSAGHAHASGVEGEMSWNFWRKWTIGFDGNRTVSKFDDFQNSDGTNNNGNLLPFVPAFAAAAHLTTSLDTGHGIIKPAIDLRVTGPQYFDIENKLQQPTFAQLDLRATWLFGSRYEFTVYANNVTDKLYRTYGFMSGSGGSAQISFGRTVGFNLRIASAER
ncbi:TonB-dependent receptor [Candidatus Kirkpatrickella diaphorinae]|uniref:TonB-dependent receptor n=1 Tax=Candidatus Kirkpatrickella diaphorinae TaxID=2984322 RepID=A0ABY6GJC8_9PROT|nr:TonB-dependent receptor [Candidatus Kirkpatrickella diaphorinae]UYH51626.1 TonB-dependent receptor [Candidatus Kirkpatrickella diaphorinae]